MIVNPSQANDQMFLIGQICYLICFECEISWIPNLITNFRQMLNASYYLHQFILNLMICILAGLLFHYV